MKKLLVMMLVLTASVMLLAGCGADAQEQVSESVSEAVSEVVSEEVSEEVSEVVSEELSEEIVEEEFYSAEEVMALVDDLIVKYPYNDPEHIKCLVIGANLDYIKAEKLEIILTTYGYTLEELAELYVSETGVIYDAAFKISEFAKLEAVSSGEKIIRSFSKAFSESIVEYGPYEEYISS